MEVSGQTVIITGASSGIGQAVAHEFANAGANIVLASRSKAKLDGIAAELPGRTLVVPTDVTERYAAAALIRKTAEEFGSVDVLINNAGVGLFAPIADGNIENALYLFEVNFWGAVNVIQAAAPYMLDQGSGHIVNVSSIAGHIAPPYMGMYAATKHALAAMSDALRVELGGTGVGVSTIYPGLTDTSFTENMLQEVEAPEIPPVVRWAPASAVAHRIHQAVRWGIRDAYVSPEDLAAVMADATMPLLMDWGMRLFMRPGPRRDVSFKQLNTIEQPAAE
ncbi:MAG: SDR family NAD(P)-dependent oxidoreductase [Chloroflexota bacterium]